MADTITTKTITWGAGRNVIWAGTPVNTNGKVANDSTAVGVVAYDLHMPNRSLQILTAGSWDETLPAHQKSGIILSNAAKKAMSDITFTVAPVTLIDETALAAALHPATTEEAGIVKQAEAIADATDAPTMAEFNGLLGALRDAGIIAEEETEEETT